MAETQDGLREQYWLGLDVMLEDLPMYEAVGVMERRQ